METKHTPGPWYKASTGNHQGLVISEATGANVAVTYDEKDADLVSASLDLLEALVTVMEMDVKGHQLQDRLQFSTAGREILSKVNAAIAKAKGEPQ